ncbi:MAG: ribbon-helix-helix domain-containing protein [Clostridiales bacterium]|nr:ribbon-helix-helix domain-containing protein [Clostridiales bacterium]
MKNKTERINVRANKEIFILMKFLSKKLNVSNADIIEKAIERLFINLMDSSEDKDKLMNEYGFYRKYF